MIGAAVAAGIGAYGAIKGAQDKAQSLDYEAKIQAQNAHNTMVSAKLNSDKAMMQFTKMQGQDIANYAASGVSADSGSVLSVLASNVEGAELDKQNILYGGQIRAINYENQQSVDQVAGGRVTQAGYIGAAGGLFLAGARSYGSTISSNDDGE